MSKILIPDNLLELNNFDFTVAALIIAAKPKKEKIYSMKSREVINLLGISSKLTISTINKYFTSICVDRKGKTYTINIDKFWRDKNEHYARLYSEDVLKIATSEYRNKYYLMKQYAVIMKSLSNKTNLSNLPIKYYAQKLGVNEHTIINANARLEELGVLSIYHSSAVQMSKEGHFYTVHNIYGNKYNQKKVLKTGKRVAAGSNKKNQQLGTKLMWYKKGKQYTPDEVQELKEYCLATGKSIDIFNKS